MRFSRSLHVVFAALTESKSKLSIKPENADFE